MAEQTGHAYYQSWEFDMYKALQALLDAILLAAGAVELGSTPYSPGNTKPDTNRRAASKPASARDLPIEQAIRSDTQVAPARRKHHVSG